MTHMEKYSSTIVLHYLPYYDTIIVVILMDMKNHKATFVLPSWILEDMAECVRRGLAHSVSALVRDALEEKLRILREEMLRAEFKAAAQDPEFMSDLDDSMSDFEEADRETARMIRP
jgi:Arc/MetJ-type ribon-helix-helix transcriptional regulator